MYLINQVFRVATVSVFLTSCLSSNQVDRLGPKDSSSLAEITLEMPDTQKLEASFGAGCADPEKIDVEKFKATYIAAKNLTDLQSPNICAFLIEILDVVRVKISSSGKEEVNQSVDMIKDKKIPNFKLDSKLDHEIVLEASWSVLNAKAGSELPLFIGQATATKATLQAATGSVSVQVAFRPTSAAAELGINFDPSVDPILTGDVDVKISTIFEIQTKKPDVSVQQFFQAFADGMAISKATNTNAERDAAVKAINEGHPNVALILKVVAAEADPESCIAKLGATQCLVTAVTVEGKDAAGKSNPTVIKIYIAPPATSVVADLINKKIKVEGRAEFIDEKAAVTTFGIKATAIAIQ